MERTEQMYTLQTQLEFGKIKVRSPVSWKHPKAQPGLLHSEDGPFRTEYTRVLGHFPKQRGACWDC